MIHFTASGVGSFNNNGSNLTAAETDAVSPPSLTPVTLSTAPAVFTSADFEQGSLVAGQPGHPD